jgi:hypothetical protein
VQPWPCVTENVCPATVNVAAREVLLVGLTVKATEPGPLPDAPCVMAIQSALLTAVQGQPAPAVTAMVPGPPAAVAACAAGAIA